MAKSVTVRRKRPKPSDNSFAMSALTLADNLRRDVQGQWSDNRLEQSNHYKGVIYIAVQAIMDALLSTTVQINRKHRRFNQTSLRLLEKALPTPAANSEDEQFRPFDDPGHSLVKLIETPNRTDTFNELLAQLVLQYYLTGSGLMWANPNDLGVPAELYVLPTALCYPQPATPDYPEGWWRVQQYYPSGGYGILPSPMAGGGAAVDGRDILRFKNPHPLWRWDAMSPLTACAVQLDVLESIDLARWTAMKSGLTPDMVLLAPGVIQSQLDAYLARLQQTNIGERNFRKVMAIGGDQGDAKFDVKFPSLGPKDMDFASGWDQMTAFALAAFGVPKSVAGLATTGSYAELYAAIKQFHTLKLRPLCARLGVWLTRHLAHIWGRDLAIQLDLPTIDDQQLHETQLQTDLAHDGLTYNEYRAVRGRKPVPGGDVLVSVYVQQQQAKAQAQLQAMQQQPQPGGDQQAASDPAGAPQPSTSPNGSQPQEAGGASPDPTAGAGASPDPTAGAGASPDPAAPSPQPGGDQLAQVLGTGEPGSAEQSVRDAVTDHALAALGVPQFGEAVTPSPIEGDDGDGMMSATGWPTHQKAMDPKPKSIAKPIATPTAAPTNKPAAPKPATSDALTKQQETNREPGEQYASESGKLTQQTAADTPAPAPKPKPAANPYTSPPAPTTAAAIRDSLPKPPPAAAPAASIKSGESTAPPTTPAAPVKSSAPTGSAAPIKSSASAAPPTAGAALVKPGAPTLQPPTTPAAPVKSSAPPAPTLAGSVGAPPIKSSASAAPPAPTLTSSAVPVKPGAPTLQPPASTPTAPASPVKPGPPTLPATAGTSPVKPGASPAPTLTGPAPTAPIKPGAPTLQPTGSAAPVKPGASAAPPTTGAPPIKPGASSPNADLLPHIVTAKKPNGEEFTAQVYARDGKHAWDIVTNQGYSVTKVRGPHESRSSSPSGSRPAGAGNARNSGPSSPGGNPIPNRPLPVAEKVVEQAVPVAPRHAVTEIQGHPQAAEDFAALPDAAQRAIAQYVQEKANGRFAPPLPYVGNSKFRGHIQKVADHFARTGELPHYLAGLGITRPRPSEERPRPQQLTGAASRQEIINAIRNHPDIQGLAPAQRLKQIESLSKMRPSDLLDYAKNLGVAHPELQGKLSEGEVRHELESRGLPSANMKPEALYNIAEQLGVIPRGYRPGQETPAGTKAGTKADVPVVTPQDEHSQLALALSRHPRVKWDYQSLRAEPIEKLRAAAQAYGIIDKPIRQTGPGFEEVLPGEEEQPSSPAGPGFEEVQPGEEEQSSSPAAPAAAAAGPRPGNEGRKGRNPAGPKVAPVADRATLAAMANAGQFPPKESFAPHGRLLSKLIAAHPMAAQTVARVNEWADAQAAPHAQRVADHFGIPLDKARAMLAHAIKAVAEHAAVQHAAGNGIGPVNVKLGLNGKSLPLRFNARTQAARKIITDMSAHLRSGNPINEEEAAHIARAVEHVSPEEARQSAAAMAPTTIKEARAQNALETFVDQHATGGNATYGRQKYRPLPSPDDTPTPAPSESRPSILSSLKRGVAAGLAGAMGGARSMESAVTDVPQPAMAASAPALPRPGHELEPPQAADLREPTPPPPEADKDEARKYLAHLRRTRDALAAKGKSTRAIDQQIEEWSRVAKSFETRNLLARARKIAIHL